MEQKKKPKSNEVPRPPIVVVLGHVDHGKTTLLDAIRETSLAAREAGGITQSIGASTITHSGKRITFIDTPGHASFTKMRSRGASVADIAVLVVAADDGVKPQTKEAINIIHEAKIPFLVAITKTDLPSASIEAALASLEKEGVFFEARGGQTPFIAVSARKGEGITELLELISLISEINEIKASENSPLEAVVLETRKDKFGQTASVVVRNGTLKVGQEVFVEGKKTKIRGIFGEKQQKKNELLPGDAGLVLGFEEVPPVGAVFTDIASPLTTSQKKSTVPPSLLEGQIGIFLKTKTAGSLEAILSSLPVGTVVVASGVGDVTESDIATARSANIAIFCFEIKVSPNITRLADADGVTISRFDVIYDLIKAIEDLLSAGHKQIMGKMEILKSFPFDGKKVAGGKILSGQINKSTKVSLVRGEQVLGEVKVVTMRKGKTNIDSAHAGEELGVVFEPQLAFAPGDMLVSTK